jgi:hypothetical protein
MENIFIGFIIIMLAAIAYQLSNIADALKEILKRMK